MISKLVRLANNNKKALQKNGIAYIESHNKENEIPRINPCTSGLIHIPSMYMSSLRILSWCKQSFQFCEKQRIVINNVTSNKMHYANVENSTYSCQYMSENTLAILVKIGTCLH